MIEENKIDDIFELYKIISDQTCPICNKKSPITVVKNRFVVGVIFISHRETYYKLGCKRCLRLHLVQSIVISLLFGWWSILYGIIHTIYATVINFKKMFFLQILNSDFLKFIAINQENIEKIIFSEIELANFIKKSKYKISIY